MNTFALKRHATLPLLFLGALLLSVWIFLNLEKQAVLIFVTMYALAFWLIAWKWPAAALVLIFSIAPFQNDLGNGELKFSLAEIHIALLFPLVLARCYADKRPFRVGPTLIPVLVYFGLCAYTSIYYPLGRSTIISVAQMAIYLVFVVGVFASYPRRAEEIRPALYGLLVVGSIMAVYTVVSRDNFFWGLTKNSVGQSYACTVLVALELWFATTNPKIKNWVLLAMVIAAVGLVFSVSRGAWMGCFFGAMLICGIRRQYQLVLRAGVLIIPVFAIAWQFLPASTKSYATDFSASRYNIQARYIFIDTAQKMWAESPIIGKGVGIRKNYDSTNLVWSTLAESGVLGLAALFWIHGAFFWMVYKTQKLVRRDSMHFSLLLIGGALVLRHFIHGMVDHYWTRGAVTLSWGGAGMAVYSWYVVRQELKLRAMQAGATRMQVQQERTRWALSRGQRRLPNVAP